MVTALEAAPDLEADRGIVDKKLDGRIEVTVKPMKEMKEPSLPGIT